MGGSKNCQMPSFLRGRFMSWFYLCLRLNTKQVRDAPATSRKIHPEPPEIGFCPLDQTTTNYKSLTYLVDEADALLMYLTTGGGSDLRLDACLQSWSLTAFLICGTLCKLLCIIIYTFKSSASRLLNKQVLREEMGAERGNCYVSHTFRQNNQKSISQYMYYIDHHFPIPT